MQKINLLLLFVLLVGCGNPQPTLQQNSLVADSLSKDKKLNDAELMLIGYWFMPHVAFINITFYKDGTFLFNDYNAKLGEEEVLKGIFEVNGEKLILKYDDRPQQTFKFYKDNLDDYYIRKGDNYYFVKVDN